MNQILERHGLSRPDSRPLYGYRITDAEFDQLTESLKLSALLGVNNIYSLSHWDAGFVIYASEWWRRKYTGQWGWDGIFKSIGINYKELSVGKRNALIETGLHRWKRLVRSRNGSRQLLGSIATEGGLPLYQLSNSGGWLARVLNPVIKRHLSKGASIPALISSYEDFIPRSYRSEEMNEILTDIVTTVTQLRLEHQLELKEKPIQWLETNIPEWRDQFPLPIDNQTAQSLLGELIKTAAKETNLQRHNPFEIERFLIQAEASTPKVVVQMDLPSFVSLEDIGLDNAKENIPTNFIIEVIEPHGISWPWCRGYLTVFKGKQCIKLSGRSFKLFGDDAIKELNIRFHAMGDVFFEIPLVNGFELDTELPWLFRNVDNKWLLHGIASQTIKDKDALIYIPSKYFFNSCNDETSILKNGRLFNGNIFSLSGSIQCSSGDSRFKISTGAEESVLQYRLNGKRYNNFSVPSEIYIGKPGLVESNLITGHTTTRKNRQLVAKLVGVDTKWQPLAEVKQGYYEIRLNDPNGNILLQKRVGILDENFSYLIKPDNQSVSEGSLVLNNLYNCRLDEGEECPTYKVKSSINSTEIHLKSKETPPQHIDVFSNPQDQRRELLLRFPYPSRGSLLFNAEGKMISFSTPLYHADLRGYRIKVFDNQLISERKATIEFTLVDTEISSSSLKDMYINVPIRLTNQITEFSIYNWIQPIEALLGVSTSPDSFVKISLIKHGQEQFCISIRQFGNMIIPDYDAGFVELSSTAFHRVTSDKLDSIKVHALYLNQPAQSDCVLPAKTSEGIARGQWLFQPEKRSQGPWIIYPPVDSCFNFRPILWNVGEPSCNEVIANSLPKAVVIFDTKLRENSIRLVLRKMACEYDHKSWEYLDFLWKKTHHLPTSTFDIWKIAISEPSFIASLLLHNNDELIEKLESELPLLWELVPLQDWKQALQAWVDKLSTNLDDKDLIDDLLLKKIEVIESRSLSMVGIGKIIRLELLGQNSPELLAIDLILRPQIKIELQGLLRRKADQDWPELLNRHVIDYFQSLDESYSSLLKTPLWFQQSIAYLPAVLAWNMLTGESFHESSNSAVDIFKIKQLKSFDDDWFNSIFQLLSVWLYQHLKQKELSHDK